VGNELLRLTLLAPDIIEQLMAGRQPRRLTLMWLSETRHAGGSGQTSARS
jgi:hypothetical protein